MSETITTIFSYGTILSHIVFIFILIACFFYKSFGRPIVLFIGKNSIAFGFLITLSAFVGSLVYSNYIGFIPCELCWWQRIFLYPQVVLFLVALYKHDEGVFKYVVPLSFLALLISLYHTYIQLGGTTSVLPCTVTGAVCAKVYVLQFGYITIPTMAVTVALYVILLAFVRRLSIRI